MKTKHKNKKVTPLVIVLCVILGIYSVSLFIPLMWGTMSSFKDKFDFLSNMFGLPKTWHFDNYSKVLKAFFIKVEKGDGFRNVYVAEMVLNSVLYAVGSALVQTTVQYVMAYVSSRFKFKYCSVIYGIVIFAMIFPVVGTTASSLYVAYLLHLNDNIVGMYIMKAHFLGTMFLIFHAQLKAFPKDYAEAAYMDGAGNFTIMTKIMLPLVRNTFFTIMLLQFIGYWNDYTTPMLYMPNVPTLSYGLYYFNHVAKDNIARNTTMRLSACIMMMLPILILFLFFHNRLIGNISMGGLKE